MADAYTKFMFFGGSGAGVVQVYDTAPGVDPRVSEVVLSTGGTTYAFPGNWSLYNQGDDRVYVRCTKDTGSGAVPMTIVFDPRAMAVVSGAEFPEVLYDVQGDTVWTPYLTSFTGDLVAYDTTTFAEVFRTPYDSDDQSFRFQQAIKGRRALIYDFVTNEPALTIFVITITGPTTYSSSTPIILDDSVYWPTDQDPTYCRPYAYSSNKMWLRGGTGVDGGILGGIFDIDANTVTYVYNPPGEDIGGDTSPYWDSVSNRMWFMAYSYSPSVVSPGFAVDMATGVLEGPYGGSSGSLGPTDWFEGWQLTAGGLFLMRNDVNTNLGVFVAGSAASLVASEILTSSTMTTPIGGLLQLGIGPTMTPGIVAVPPDSSPEPPVVPPRLETSIGGGGSCGVQFERLEMFHLLKSLMGSGRTLEQAMKFLEQDDVDFLEEEELLDDLPQEIPKPARQGTSPKMVDRRINLAPITKLNSLIAEFETKLQNCRTTQRREYDK